MDRFGASIYGSGGYLSVLGPVRDKSPIHGVDQAANAIILADNGDLLGGSDVVIGRWFLQQVLHLELLFQFLASCSKGESSAHGVDINVCEEGCKCCLLSFSSLSVRFNAEKTLVTE